MFSFFLPILAFLAAVGITLTYIKPTYEEVQATLAETQDYIEAANKASELRDRIAELVDERNNFSTPDLARLDTMLPNSQDEVALVLNLDALSKEHRLQLNGIRTEAAEKKTAAQRVLTELQGRHARTDAGAGTEQLYVPQELSFTALGTYDDVRAFLADLEQSVVLTEVTHLAFSETEGDLMSFDVTIRVFIYKLDN